MSERNEILLVDKPRGISSFDVIRALRKGLGVIKMGHAGTLDPLASGLLIVGVGEGTKELYELIGLDKTYEMEVLLGRLTETGDMEGKVINELGVIDVVTDNVKKVLKSLEGEIELEAPIYSALKIRGVPMYKLARRGKKVEPKKRKMKIYSLKLLNHRRATILSPEPVEGKLRGFGLRLRSGNKLSEERKENFYILKVELNCGSGTYARSIAEEIGRRLGLPACVYSLRRTKIGDYKVEDAIRLDARAKN